MFALVLCDHIPSAEPIVEADAHDMVLHVDGLRDRATAKSEGKRRLSPGSRSGPPGAERWSISYLGERLASTRDVGGNRPCVFVDDQERLVRELRIDAVAKHDLVKIDEKPRSAFHAAQLPPCGKGRTPDPLE